MVLIAPMVIASPAGTWSMASPTASRATTAMLLRSATRQGTSRGLVSIRARSTGRFLAGARAFWAIRFALLLRSDGGRAGKEGVIMFRCRCLAGHEKQRKE